MGRALQPRNFCFWCLVAAFPASIFAQSSVGVQTIRYSSESGTVEVAELTKSDVPIRDFESEISGDSLKLRHVFAGAKFGEYSFTGEVESDTIKIFHRIVGPCLKVQAAYGFRAHAFGLTKKSYKVVFLRENVSDLACSTTTHKMAEANVFIKFPNKVKPAREKLTTGVLAYGGKELHFSVSSAPSTAIGRRDQPVVNSKRSGESLIITGKLRSTWSGSEFHVFKRQDSVLVVSAEYRGDKKDSVEIDYFVNLSIPKEAGSKIFIARNKNLNRPCESQLEVVGVVKEEK